MYSFIIQNMRQNKRRQKYKVGTNNTGQKDGTQNTIQAFTFMKILLVFSQYEVINSIINMEVMT